MLTKRHPLPCLVIVALLLTGSARADVTPDKLLIYYGFPTSINMSFGVLNASGHFNDYDLVVLGDGLTNPSHPDHQNTIDIIAHPLTAATSFFGYIDLGVSTQNLSQTEIETRIAGWKAMGADGIFFDDFGYDFGTSRGRQNAAVDAAHAQGLPVIANAFVPADAFSAAIDLTYNPTGVATSLGASDFYLYESHQIRLAQYDAEATWRTKADAIEAFRQALGFGVLSITTTNIDDPAAYDANQFFYAWHSALLSGHVATGWGEFSFSAAGASNGQAPFRTRPSVSPGTSFLGGVVDDSPVFLRNTDVARIHVDTSDHSYAVTPHPQTPALPPLALGLAISGIVLAHRGLRR